MLNGTKRTEDYRKEGLTLSTDGRWGGKETKLPEIQISSQLPLPTQLVKVALCFDQERPGWKVTLLCLNTETPYYAPVQRRTARCYFWNPQGQAARHTSVYVPVGWGGAGHTEIPTDKMPSV